MKLLRLDLIAFGPFSEQTLDFGDGNGLHIVHGRNEAGKSSSLRALRNLLFGIPTRCDDDFVHAYQNLRIGGAFEAADGSRLEFIRRKGRTKTLRDSDDDGLFDETRLERLLAGVDEETFRQRFGIDYTELRRGGEAIVDGGGDLKEILFAAGAGVADLRTIQQQLEEEGDSLFRPRGSNQRIAQALTELQAARRTIKETQLPTAQWVEHDKALRQARERLQEIDAQLARQRTERHRLLRVRDSLPLIGQLKPLRQRLHSLADAPLLPETFSADRVQAESNLENARHDADVAAREIQRLEEQLSDVDVPAGLLEHRTAIEQLHTDLGSYRKAAKDRPGLNGRCEAARQSAREILEQLGGPTRLEQADSLRLPKVQRKRIQDLTVDCKALVDRQQAAEAALRRTDAELQKLEQQLHKLPPQRDAAELQRVIRRVQKHGDLDAQASCARQELDGLAEQARVDLARLTLFSGTLEELEQLPIPPAETIERFESELADADENARRCREKIDELTAAAQQCQGKLDALRLEGEVPTEADLQTARNRRDAGWELLRQTRRGSSEDNKTAAADFIEEFAAGGDLTDAFRASLDRADQLADRLRREADRVAEKARLTAQVQRNEADLVQARDRLEAARQHRDQVLQQWQAHWEPAGMQPLTPREMRSWCPRQQRLAATAADLRKRQTELERLNERITALRDDLNGALQALALPGVPREESLSATLESCLQIAEQIRDQTQQHERLAGEQQRLSKERPELDQQARQARQELADWRSQWAEAVAALGLDADTRPAEACAVIETVDDVLRLLDDAKKLEERIEGIDTDARKFEQAVRQLVEQVTPDLLEQLDLSVEQAVADLIDRLSQAEKDQTRIDGWQEQLHTQQAALQQARAQITRWQQALEKLCEQAGCKAPEQLPQAEQCSRERTRAESELHALQQRLCELAAGAALEQWVADVEAFDSDQVQADLTSLDEAIERLELEKQQVSVAIGEHRNELGHMDGSGQAADAQLHAEHLLASVRSSAEEYIRLRLASAVLSRAMERFRQASQGPVLERAADLFTTLTLGSFASLRPDYDAGGNAVLVGVRPDGQSVTTAGMSSGTCDQLYLALRIALLESSLQGREPLPFIVDDILIMFDDARAAAALNVLSQLAETTQVIFFTHHAHLLEVARDVLNGELHLHELRGAPAPVLA